MGTKQSTNKVSTIFDCFLSKEKKGVEKRDAQNYTIDHDDDDEVKIELQDGEIEAAVDDELLGPEKLEPTAPVPSDPKKKT